tara:strand:+ start:101 stop:307 length:207 start_codon:yes stop_codon:yes gene_type:complete
LEGEVKELMHLRTIQDMVEVHRRYPFLLLLFRKVVAAVEVETPIMLRLADQVVVVLDLTVNLEDLEIE